MSLILLSCQRKSSAICRFPLHRLSAGISPLRYHSDRKLLPSELFHILYLDVFNEEYTDPRPISWHYGLLRPRLTADLGNVDVEACFVRIVDLLRP